MPDLTSWGLFIVASVVLLLTPGPAVLFIVARSLEQGRASRSRRHGIGWRRRSVRQRS
jgi:threonine/homoserine/homoserine lactone efflux protein